jgi:hypothetical protein
MWEILQFQNAKLPTATILHAAPLLSDFSLSWYGEQPYPRSHWPGPSPPGRSRARNPVQNFSFDKGSLAPIEAGGRWCSPQHPRQQLSSPGAQRAFQLSRSGISASCKPRCGHGREARRNAAVWLIRNRTQRQRVRITAQRAPSHVIRAAELPNRTVDPHVWAKPQSILGGCS